MNKTAWKLLPTLLAVFLSALAAAQVTASDVASMVARKDLKGAARAAKELTEKNPDDSKGWQILGVLRIAIGDAVGAEEAFSKAFDKAVAAAGESGLEPHFSPGGVLSEALRMQKAIFAPGTGKAAAISNRGAARYLLGRTDEASNDIDEASRLTPEWGGPWFNGALVALEREQFELADKDGRQALLLGEKNAKVYTALAEAQLGLGRLERAEDELKSAFEYDNFYPYALLAKGRIDQKQGRSRAAERATTQALAAGPQVAVDSKLVPHASSGSALSGAPAEAHIQLFQRSFDASKGALRLDFNLVDQKVEARAQQLAGTGFLTASTKFGTLHIGRYQLNGRKPGANGTIVGITPQPDADFLLEQTHIMFLKPVDFGTDARLWLHANYSDALVKIRMDDVSPYATSVADTEWLGEARLDWKHGARAMSQLGAAYGTFARRGTGGRPFEPTEQVLPTGHFKIWTAYAVHRRPLADRVGVTAGLMVASAVGNQQLQPFLDFGLRASDSRTVHLRATPRFNDSVSNLIPLDLVAESPQRNEIDRHDFSTTFLGRDPMIQGTRSRFIDFELAITDDGSLIRRFETIAFHRRLTNTSFQGADPRLATTLNLTPITSGEATGIEERVRWILNDGLSVRLVARLQQTVADFTNVTYQQSGYPGTVPAESQGLPNFPKFQSVLSLDYADNNWNASLIGAYYGARPTAITTIFAGSPTTYLSTSPAAANVNVIVVRKLGSYATARLMIFNIGSASFYQGYRGAITSVFGYEYRF